MIDSGAVRLTLQCGYSYNTERYMHVRLFGFLTFALSSLALPHIAHAARANDGRRVRAAADCAAALRIALPHAHITAARAVPTN
jgi:hypothetical protein